MDTLGRADAIAHRQGSFRSGSVLCRDRLFAEAVISRNLPVDTDRLLADIEALAAITDPDRPWTRRAFSPRFLEGRALVERRMREAGLTVRLDAAGNMIGRRPGREPGRGVIVIGSHTDTVPDGGRFDGIAGVVAGLEVARVLNERGIDLAHDLDIIDCLAEEVSIYGLSCVGSRAIAGTLSEDMLRRRSPEGEVLADGINRMGGDVAALATARRSDIRAYLELHIEQGTVLEGEGRDIGIVTAIVGITRFEIILHGRADHAGTTPMGRRADALVAAATLVTDVDAIARRLAAAGTGHFAATVGEFAIEPNAANVVPSRARLLIDTRAERRPVLDAFHAELKTLVATVTAAHGVSAEGPSIVSDNQPTPSDPDLLARLEAACDGMGATHRRMASGAGHDMAWFARVAPAAMIFVPSRDGRSHTPEEWTEPGEIAVGAAVLLETVLALDRDGTEAKPR